MNKKSAISGHTALLVGRTGNVSEGIVCALLRGGSTARIPSRTAEKLDRLSRGLDNDASYSLITLVGDVVVLEQADRVRREVLARTVQIEAAAAALGSWWQRKPLIDVPVATWSALLHSQLASHFALAQALLRELLKSGGAYIFIN